MAYQYSATLPIIIPLLIFKDICDCLALLFFVCRSCFCLAIGSHVAEAGLKLRVSAVNFFNELLF